MHDSTRSISLRNIRLRRDVRRPNPSSAEIFVEKVEGLNRILTDKENAGEVRNYERIHVEIICTQK